MPDAIPMLDLRPEIEALGDEFEAAARDVIRSGRFILGPQVEDFEREVAHYLGVAHAIGVNSGTDALVIALRGFGVGPGDEVLTSAYTYFATAEAISLIGATPVFCDIRPGLFTLDPADAEARITPRTRAILPIHLFGHAADMDSIQELAARHGLRVLEDVAQAFGALYHGRKLGGIGDAAAFSFFPSKNLGAFGDGGLLVTNDEQLAESARLLRTHGTLQRDVHDRLGYNSRLDEMQAAILRVKLPHVDEWNEGRRRVAARYDQELGDLTGIAIPSVAPEALHVYHQYTIRVADGGRDDLAGALARAGIASAVYYRTPVHQLEIYASDAPSLPVAEAASREALSLPIGPMLDPASIDRVVAAVRSWSEARA
jgi:dTDP-4-amino-4,6-dideoxygalactose transaminase